MNTNMIRWGMIGCGAVTEVKSGPAYQKVENFILAAVTRRDQALAQDYADRHNIDTVHVDADALINDPTIDAIYIATPPDSHKALALKVAQAGKICCVEKPLAPSYADCQSIVDAFERAQLPLFVAYYRRSLPRFNHIKQLLDDGEIGEVRHINWHLNKPANSMDLSQQYNWRTDKMIAAGGYFDDLASHGLDLFAYLLGDFSMAKGVGINQQHLYTALDAVSACWLHTNGATGSGSWNFGGHSRQDKVVIYGSRGEIRFSVFDESPIEVITEDKQQQIMIENPTNIQLYHIDNMRKQLLEGKQHPSTGVTAAHTGWVMSQIVAS
ncbi:Gfo/Idh/MocA family protein [Photobacterium iliopiscarium]|uniref:Gfo/Idh/MocA family protein n=1 Tax=Photobacterium iliopiscarium TaxID=56192 RepID=UPI001E5A3F8C|nr:Gfo/Idh/MocA family oxidoreductase [Photobacterium iliopiscarium]